MVIKNLNATIYDTRAVQEMQVLNGLFGKTNDQLGVIAILRYAQVSVQDWRIQPNANLWRGTLAFGRHVEQGVFFFLFV